MECIGMGGEVFEECFEMNNGCICCSIRDELVTTLERIMKKRHKFDYVLVETTGMANPGPLANIFWLDDGQSTARSSLSCHARFPLSCHCYAASRIQRIEIRGHSLYMEYM